MTLLTGGETAVKTLIAHNIHTLFGLPGVQNDWLYNALHDAQDQIRVIHTRHEQGAGYMALGYTLATGEISIFNVVPGPGLLNASAALATAYGLNAPVLCLTGQIPTRQIGKGKGVLHEIPDQLAILRGKVHVNQAQGYLFGKAMPADAVRQLLREQPVSTVSPQAKAAG